MFETFRLHELFFSMEEPMQVMGRLNCSYWGTCLFGNSTSEPYIGHLDGRRSTIHPKEIVS